MIDINKAVPANKRGETFHIWFLWGNDPILGQTDSISSADQYARFDWLTQQRGDHSPVFSWNKELDLVISSWWYEMVTIIFVSWWEGIIPNIF